MSQFIYNFSSGKYEPDPANKPENFKSLKKELEEAEEKERAKNEQWLQNKTESEDNSITSVGGLISETKSNEAPKCKVHESYTGKRLGAKAKQCESCVNLYNWMKVQGFKEKRDRK